MRETARTQYSQFQMKEIIPLVRMVASHVAEEEGVSLGFEHMEIIDPGRSQTLLLRPDEINLDIYRIRHPFKGVNRDALRRFTALVDEATSIYQAVPDDFRVVAATDFIQRELERESQEVKTSR